MKLTTWLRPGTLAGALLAALFVAAGCHSHQIETTVDNRTGGTVKLLEVDYPSASFGKDILATGDRYHYRIQLRGNGPLKVQYTANDGSPAQIEGPTVAEGQEGRLEIALLPGGKAEFHSELTPSH